MNKSRIINYGTNTGPIAGRDIVNINVHISEKEFNKLIEQQNPELKIVEDNASKKVGGKSFIIDMSKMFNDNGGLNQGFFLPANLLGFKRVEDKNALVNLIIEGKVKLHELKLVTDNTLFVIFDIENLTDKPIKFNIPLGQVFENADKSIKVQNLASTKTFTSVLKKGEKKRYKIEALCLNEKYPNAKDAKGAIAIYETINKIFAKYPSFLRQQRLWAKLRCNFEKHTIKFYWSKKIGKWSLITIGLLTILRILIPWILKIIY